MDVEDARTIGRRVRQIRYARASRCGWSPSWQGSASRTWTGSSAVRLLWTGSRRFLALAEALEIAPSELIRLLVPAPASVALLKCRRRGDAASDCLNQSEGCTAVSRVFRGCVDLDTVRHFDLIEAVSVGHIGHRERERASRVQRREGSGVESSDCDDLALGIIHSHSGAFIDIVVAAAAVAVPVRAGAVAVVRLEGQSSVEGEG